jgi:two-component system LytT family response regulator
VLSNRPALRLLVVESDPLTRALVSEVVGARDDFRIVGQCADESTVVIAIRKLQPDVALVDLDCPRMRGFDVARALDARRMPLIVFISSAAANAAAAFDVDAVDFLLKPFDSRRFQRALDRVRRCYELQNGARIDESPAGSPPAATVRKVSLRRRGEAVFVSMGDIEWIETAGDELLVHVASQIVRVRRTLASMEHELDPSQFVRVHRSAIVNMDQVVAIRMYHRNSHAVELRGGTTIPIGRARRNCVASRLAARQGYPDASSDVTRVRRNRPSMR